MEKKKPLLWTMALTALASSNAMAQADATSQIANPGFESNLQGWTNAGSFKAKTKPASFEGAEGKVCCKESSKSFLEDAQISQKIKLPVGVYELSAIGRVYSVDEALNVAYVDGFFLFAGEKTVALKEGSAPSVLQITVTDPTQELVIGAKLVNAKGNMAQVDNFQLVLSQASLDAAIAELTQKLSIVINKTKAVTEDQFIKDVLVEASELQAEINAMDFDAYAAYKNAKEGNFADKIKTLGEEVEKLVANKKQYDLAKSAYSTLDAKKTALEDAYAGDTDKLFKETYEAVVASYKAYLTDLEDAYEAKNAGALFTDNVIAERIQSLSEVLEGTTEAIKTGNQNLAAYNAVKTKIANALVVYTNKSNELYENLSGEHHEVYADWHAEATVAINKVKKNIQAIADANEAAKNAADDTKNAFALKAQHETEIAAAVTALGTITSEWKAKADVLKANYEAACVDVNTLTTALNNLFGDDAPKAVFDVTAIETAIAALQANVDAANKAHTIKGTAPFCEKYNEDKAAIVEQINELAVVVAEYKANNLTVKAIAALQEKFNEAKKAVGELVSDDEAYAVADMYPETEKAIQEAIDKFTADAKDAYDQGKAGEFNTNLNTTDAEAMVTEYQQKAEAALAKYNTLSEAIKGYEDALAALKEVVVDADVTVGANLTDGAETYGQAIALIAGEIKTIKDNLSAVLAEKDAKHYDGLMNFTPVTTNIVRTASLEADYKQDASDWNAAQQDLAKEKILNEANARLVAMEIPAEFTAEDYGKKTADLNTTRSTIIAGVNEAKANVAAAEAKEPAEAIAMLSTTVVEISKIEAELAKLIVEADKIKAEYTAEKEAKAAKEVEIAKIKALLNGKAQSGEEAEILSVEALNEDPSKDEHFADEVAKLNALISALESDLANSFVAETVREDNKDHNGKDGEGKDIVLPGYNTRANTLLSDVNKLRDEAVAATANYNAYNETVEYIGSVDGQKILEAIVKAKADVESKDAATGAALIFYIKEIGVQENALTQLCEDIKDAYDNGEAVAKKAGFTGRADAILEAVNGFGAEAKANEAAKNDLETKYNDVKEYLEDVRNEVSSSVEIPAEILKVYMAQFSELDATLEKTYEAIITSWGKGTSVADEASQAKSLSDVETEVKRLKDSWRDDYNAEVATYNAETKADFDEKHTALKEVYSEAVELIAAMSKTSYGSQVIAELEKVTGEEDGIYSYATKIRTLKTEADAEYIATKEGHIFDENKKFAATAVRYNEEITAKLKTYTDAVNAKAEEIYSGRYAEINSLYNSALNKIANFEEAIKTTALSEIKALIDNAVAAHEKNNFATQLDAILLDFNLIKSTMLNQAIEKAAKDQYALVLQNVEQLYAEESAAIAKLHNEDGVVGAYSVAYFNLYNNSVKKAIEAYTKKAQNAPGASYYDYVTATVKPLFDKYISTISDLEVGKDAEGESIYESHTAIYQAAYTADKAYHANDVALAAVLEAAADVQAELDAVKVYAASLLAAHNVNSNGRITLRQNQLQAVINQIKNAHYNGIANLEQETCLEDLGLLSSTIADLYKDVIEAEHADVLAAIATLRYDYDRATGADLDNAELDGYKQIIADYANYNDEYRMKFIVGVLPEDADERVYATKEETQKSYLALETRIGEVRAELAAHYDASLVESTMAELNAAIADVEADYNTLVAQLAKCHAPVVNKYTETIQAIADAIEAEKAHIAGHAETILLYADNHKKDIEAIEAMYTEPDLSKIIADDEIPYDENDDAYARLTAQVQRLQANLDKKYEASADYDYLAEADYGYEDKNGNWVSVMKTVRQGEYDIYCAQLVNEQARIDSENLKQTALKNSTQLETPEAIYLYSFAKYEKSLASHNYSNTRASYYSYYRTVCNLFNGYRYTASDKLSLRNEMNALSSLYTNLVTFMNNAELGHVTYDIDGNLINEGKGKDIAYMDAYAAAMTRLAEMNARLEKWAEDVEDKSYKLGDIDHNKTVDVVDYSYARNIVLGLIEVEEESPKFYAADVNTDKEINIGDVTMIANKIMTGSFDGDGSFAARMKGYTAANNDALALVTEGTGSVQRIAINLKNAVQYVGAQMDIKLPAGVTIVGESLTSRADSHDLMSNEVNGMHRIIVSSIENVAFLNTEDALIYLDVEVSADYAGGAVEVVNAVFADASARTYRLGAASTDTETGITQLGTSEKVIKKIYSVGGQMMNSLRKGVNIIMNSDGTTSKVLKK